MVIPQARELTGAERKQGFTKIVFVTPGKRSKRGIPRDFRIISSETGRETGSISRIEFERLQRGQRKFRGELFIEVPPPPDLAAQLRAREERLETKALAQKEAEFEAKRIAEGKIKAKDVVLTQKGSKAILVRLLQEKARKELRERLKAPTREERIRRTLLKQRVLTTLERQARITKELRLVKPKEEPFRTPEGLISAEPRFIGVTPERKLEIRLEKIPLFLERRLRITKKPLERIGAGIGLFGVELIRGAAKGPLVAPLIVRDIPLLGVSIAKGEFFPEIGKEIRERPQVLGEIIGTGITAGRTLQIFAEPAVLKFREARFERGIRRFEKGLPKFTEKEIRAQLKKGGIIQPSKEIQTTFGEDIRVISQEQAARLRAFEKAKAPLKRPGVPTRVAVIETVGPEKILTLEKVGRFETIEFGKLPQQFRRIRLRLARAGEIKITPIERQALLVEPKPRVGIFRKLPEPTKFVQPKAKPPKPFIGKPSETLDIGRLAAQQLIREKAVFIEPPIETFPREQFRAILEQPRIEPIIRRGIRPTRIGFVPISRTDIIRGVERISLPERKVARAVSPISRVTLKQDLISDIERISKTKQRPIQETFRDLIREPVIDRITRAERIVGLGDITITEQIPELEVPTKIPRVREPPKPPPERPTPPTPPTPILLLRRRKKPKEIKRGRFEGYNAFVKGRKGRQLKVNLRRTLTKKSALSSSARVVDNSIAATGSIKKVISSKPPLDTKDNYFLRNRDKFRTFRIRKGRRIPLKDKFIEKRGKRLDTRGEVLQITAAKKIAEQRKRLAKLDVFGTKPRKRKRTVRFF